MIFIDLFYYFKSLFHYFNRNITFLIIFIFIFHFDCIIFCFAGIFQNAE